jgi:glycosyltransferase involved in cell wall biosynthesis
LTEKSIAFFTIGSREPSARFRIIPYIPQLENSGWRCTVWHATPSYGSNLYVATFKGGRYLNARLVDLIAMGVTLPRILFAGKFDLVFLQRRLPTIVWWPWLEYLLRCSAHRLVFDFDDAIYLCWKKISGFRSNARRKVAFKAIVRFSDQIIAGNQHLANFANEPLKTTIIPTSVNTDKFAPIVDSMVKKANSLTIGWTGTAANYSFLYPLVPALKQVAERFPQIRIKVICDYPPDWNLLAGLPVDFVRWQESIEVEQLGDIDVGIMYLPDDLWTKGKCGFKLIQYMALAKPAVASPVGVNVDIIKHGINGFLASSLHEWSQYLEQILCDASLRKEMGIHARQTVEEGFSVHANYPKLVQVFRRALG